MRRRAALLLDIARQQLYQRGELVVRPVRLKLRAADMQGHKRETSAWQLLQVTKPYLIETLTKVARFEKMERTQEGLDPEELPGSGGRYLSLARGRLENSDPIADRELPLLAQWMARCASAWGTILTAPCSTSRGAGQSFPSIPAAPTLEQAREALDYLDQTLLGEFPFVEKIDRSVALSLLLTALDRHAMATAPLHAFTAPVAGTGKSLLTDIASLLANGELAPVISQGSNKDETEKRLGAELLAGNAIVSFDNCASEVDSELLCQALTQRELRVRELGLQPQRAGADHRAVRV